MKADVRPYIYGGLCLIMAIVYFILFRRMIPSTHGSTQALAYSMIIVMAVMGVAMVVRHKWSWWVGIVGSGYMLLLTIILFFLIIQSAAFLSGVYGAFGKGASSMAYLGAAVIIEAVALLPALMMKYLMTRAGRRGFGLEPIWP